jgi:hypothetical protein
MAQARKKTTKKSVRSTAKVTNETDGAFFLKIVLYLVLGLQWIWVVNPSQTRQIPLPIGLLIGVLFASHDHFQIDRKIEYAILLIATALGFWLHSGIYLVTLR